MNILLSIFHRVNESPRLVAFLGMASGWFSADRIAQARDAAQLIAAIIAGLVSLCALILTAPKAVEQVRRWVRAFKAREQANSKQDPAS